jgi:hypothetical protein
MLNHIRPLACLLGLAGVCPAQDPTPTTAPDSARFAPLPSVDSSRWRFELEGGAVWTARNDAAIPGDTGTRFSLRDLTGGGPDPVGRISVEWDVAERHSLRATIAPLRTSGSGSLANPVDFQGQTFAAGPARGVYRFDTYRLTYRYRFFENERFTWRGGATLLVRDAEVTLEQGGLSETKTNTGLVPLLHLAGDWRFADRWRLSLDGDGAAASQGRAFDFSLKLGYDLSEHWRLSAGYRTIEGGADNDEVYSFGWFNAAVLSLTYGV